MQITSGYKLNEILSEGILIPIGDDERRRNAYCLNETGYFLLKKLEEGCGKDELTDAVVENFEVERGTAEQAVSQFLAELKQHHLLK